MLFHLHTAMALSGQHYEGQVLKTDYSSRVRPGCLTRGPNLVPVIVERILVIILFIDRVAVHVDQVAEVVRVPELPGRLVPGRGV